MLHVFCNTLPCPPHTHISVCSPSIALPIPTLNTHWESLSSPPRLCPRSDCWMSTVGGCQGQSIPSGWWWWWWLRLTKQLRTRWALPSYNTETETKQCQNRERRTNQSADCVWGRIRPCIYGWRWYVATCQRSHLLEGKVEKFYVEVSQLKSGQTVNLGQREWLSIYLWIM